MFYPVQYEGEETERNVFYIGATPNQQAMPAVDYLMSKDGGPVKRWVLEGTDYVYPRTTNKILEAYLKQKGMTADLSPLLALIRSTLSERGQTLPLLQADLSRAQMHVAVSIP